MADDRPIVAQQLEEVLSRKNWSIYELSQRVDATAPEGMKGLSYSSLRNYVSGKTSPKAEVLQVLADVLGVPVGLLTGATSRTTNRRVVQELDRRALGDVEAIETGAAFLLVDVGKLWLYDETEPNRMSLMYLMMSAVMEMSIPRAGRDLVLRFLWDLLSWRDTPDLTEMEDDELGDFVAGFVADAEARFFPGLEESVGQTSGSYGEEMATVLSKIQIAYLAAFGSKPVAWVEGRQEAPE